MREMKISWIKRSVGLSPNRHAPAAAANQVLQYSLPARSIHVLTHKRDWQAAVPSRSAARPAAPRSRLRVAAAPLQGFDPPIPARGRQKAHQASVIAVVELNPVRP